MDAIVRSPFLHETPQAAARETLVHPGQLELGGPVAGDEVAGGGLLPGRRLRAADVHRVGAARVEIAAGRRRRRVGDLARDDDAPGARARIWLGGGGE